MAEKDEAAPPKAGDKRSDRPETVVPPQWGANMMLYGDISRMLFRMHRNVTAHMDTQKRLTERLQAVFAHEQALVLELARLIDDSMSQAMRKSNVEKPPVGPENLDRIFDHANRAIRETGQMLTDLQVETLSLLKHYIEDPAGEAKPDTSPAALSEEKKDR